MDVPVDGKVVGPEGVLDGLHFEGLPEGWVPRAATLLIKCSDEDGDDAWSYRSSEEYLSDEELLGALVVRTKLLMRQLMGNIEETDGPGPA